MNHLLSYLFAILTLFIVTPKSFAVPLPEPAYKFFVGHPHFKTLVETYKNGEGTQEYTKSILTLIGVGLQNSKITKSGQISLDTVTKIRKSIKNAMSGSSIPAEELGGFEDGIQSLIDHEILSCVPATSPILNSELKSDFDEIKNKYEGVHTSENSIDCDECFPIERLPDELQVKGNQLLQLMLDSGFLYTIIGGIKPITQGEMTPRILKSINMSLDEFHQILNSFNCSKSLHFESRGISFSAFREDKIAEKLANHPNIFGDTVSKKNESIRQIRKVLLDGTFHHDSKAFGTLFGFPKPAVEFFSDDNNKDIPRKSITFPIYNPRNFFFGFVYAVPTDHIESPEEADLRERATRVYKSYLKTRTQFQDKPFSAAQIIRSLFKGKNGKCSPENSTY